MPLATGYDIDHKCGHAEHHDLSNLPAGKRAGRAVWLATTDCTDCFKTRNRKTLSKEVQAERAAEQQTATAQAERDQLAVLVGSEKQIEWAHRVRYELLRDTYTALVAEGTFTDDQFDAEVIVPARLIDRAHWWIDNRATSPADLPELLNDTGLDVAAVSVENPY